MWEAYSMRRELVDRLHEAGTSAGAFSTRWESVWEAFSIRRELIDLLHEAGTSVGGFLDEVGTH